MGNSERDRGVLVSKMVVRLVGGPADLTERQCVLEGLPERIAVPFLAGYEHFQRDEERVHADQDKSSAEYVWKYRTAIAE